MTAPTIQQSNACGPPMSATMSGNVMNGPMPIMLLMLSAAACGSPMPLTSAGPAPVAVCAMTGPETTTARIVRYSLGASFPVPTSTYDAHADRLGHRRDHAPDHVRAGAVLC